MKRLLCSLALSALASAPLAARATDVTSEDGSVHSSYESPRDFYLEFNGAYFYPAVSNQVGLAGSPYHQIFGTSRMWMFGLEFDWELYQGFGSLSAAVGADFATVSGHGIIARTGEVAPDSTSLRMLPLRLLAVYRFDLLARRFSIPLVPFVKAGLTDTIWFVQKGDNGLAQFGDDKAIGGKWGYELAGGLALCLNFLDPLLARELDDDFGVNGVYLHAQWTYISANNFGRGGMDLTTSTLQLGLGLEF
jgi:hypothetical protein